MKWIGSYKIDFKRQGLLKNIIFSFLISFLTLFIGLTISFIIVYNMPGDPVLAHLPMMYTQEQYYAMEHMLGFDRPMIVQYFRFISDLFSGKWFISTSTNKGQPVIDLLSERTPQNTALLLPTILGLVIGITLGKIAFKFRKRWIDKVIQSFFIIGISIPIFSFGLILQYHFAYRWDLLPGIGYKGIKYYILPGIALSVLIIALIAMKMRSSLETESHEKTVISNTITTGMPFGLIIAFYFIIEIVFNQHGISELFIRALVDSDFYVIKAILFIIIILFVVITFISNIIFSILKSTSFIKQNSLNDASSPTRNNKLDQAEKDPETDSKRDLKDYLKRIAKSPFIMIGSILVILMIIGALFPQLISGYSREEADGFWIDDWASPSPEHPLGTTLFGRDVLARVLWGTWDVLIFSLGSILIGVLGGVIFGYIASLHKWAKTAIMALMIPMFIIPSMLLIILIVGVLGRHYEVLMLTFGILLIPSFTQIIAKSPLRKSNIKSLLKKVVIYIPLELAFVILIYESIGFLGFSDPRYFGLGRDVDLARGHITDAFHALFWPGLYLFFLIVGFISLHIGLKNTFLDHLDDSQD